MQVTQHAQVRAKQRGIPPLLIDLLLQFGTSERAGTGDDDADNLSQRLLLVSVGEGSAEHGQVHTGVEHGVGLGHDVGPLEREPRICGGPSGRELGPDPGAGRGLFPRARPAALAGCHRPALPGRAALPRSARRASLSDLYRLAGDLLCRHVDGMSGTFDSLRLYRRRPAGGIAADRTAAR